MRPITPLIALALAVSAPLAVAQVSGVDTTRSLEDRAAFPDPTLPQADKYIPKVRKKVSNPLALEDDNESESPTAEEVENFVDIDAAPVVPYSEMDASTADELAAEGAIEAE